jgi:hypothetical protein
MKMKMNHDKFIDALTNSFEDNRVCTYSVAEALLREPVAIQERFIVLFMHYLNHIQPSVVVPEHMQDLSNFAQASWEEYFELIGISSITDINQPGSLLDLLLDPEESGDSWTNIKIEKQYRPQNYSDGNALWDKNSSLELFRELSTIDLKALFDKQEFEINEF